MEQSNRSIEQNKEKGLSTSTIKIIALVAMFVDHFAASVFLRLLNNVANPDHSWLWKLLGTSNPLEAFRTLADVYSVMRNIGRISFPIYCFFIVEGFVKTRNRKKYARRLAACALLSELPFDFALFGKVFDITHQNVFFTLLLGLLAIWVLNYISKQVQWDIKGKVALSMASSIVFMLAGLFLMTDYNMYGVAVIIFMYLVRKWTIDKVKFWAPIVFSVGAGLLCLLSLGEVWAFAALPLFFFYKGKKGWNGKWFFYLFYPVHLLLLGIACIWI